FVRKGSLDAAMDVCGEHVTEEGPDTAEELAAAAVSYVVDADNKFHRLSKTDVRDAASEAASCARLSVGCVRLSVLCEEFPVQQSPSLRKKQARALQAEQDAQVLLLREIIHNPCRPASFTPAWLSTTVTSLAQAAYDERSLPSGE